MIGYDWLQEKVTQIRKTKNIQHIFSFKPIFHTFVIVIHATLKGQRSSTEFGFIEFLAVIIFVGHK